MPDLMTHLTVAYLAKRAVSPKRHMVAFIAGATLPDLLSYVPGGALETLQRMQYSGHPSLILGKLLPWVKKVPLLFSPLHGLIPFLFFSWIVALLFPFEKRKGIFVNLSLGACLHFGMDLMQESHTTMGHLLFPLTRDSYSLGWIGSESSIYVAPLLAAVAAVVLIRDMVRTRRRPISSEGPGK